MRRRAPRRPPARRCAASATSQARPRPPSRPAAATARPRPGRAAPPARRPPPASPPWRARGPTPRRSPAPPAPRSAWVPPPAAPPVPARPAGSPQAAGADLSTGPLATQLSAHGRRHRTCRSGRCRSCSRRRTSAASGPSSGACWRGSRSPRIWSRATTARSIATRRPGCARCCSARSPTSSCRPTRCRTCSRGSASPTTPPCWRPPSPRSAATCSPGTGRGTRPPGAPGALAGSPAPRRDKIALNPRRGRTLPKKEKPRVALGMSSVPHRVVTLPSCAWRARHSPLRRLEGVRAPPTVVNWWAKATLGSLSMATRLQDKKADLLERVVDRLHDQLAEGQAERAEAFLRHYYRAVSAGRPAGARPARPLWRGALSSAARQPADRRRGDGARLQPSDRAARLAVDPHGGRGGHRRHAVPGRFDEHGAQPARPADPHHHPPGDAGQARPRRHARGRARIRQRRRRRGALRILHAFRGRPAERSGAHRGDPRRCRARAGRRARRGRGLAADARQGRHRDRRSAARRQGDRGDRARRGRGLPALDRRQPFHAAGLRLLRPDPRQVGRSAAAGRGLGARPAARARRPPARSRAASPPCRRSCAARPATRRPW